MNTILRVLRSDCGIALGLAALFIALDTGATPYASGVTNNGGTIQFILNEIPDSTWIIFENGASNSIASPVVGTNTFSLGSHSSFSIHVKKSGSGTPVQISSDTNGYCIWSTPRGIGININPTNGYLFGRIYIDNTSIGTKGQGLFALNADQSSILGGTNGLLGTTFATANSTVSPYRMAVGADNNLYLGDDESVEAMVWQAKPDLSSITQVFGELGESAGIAAGVHGRSSGQPIVTGSIATSNMVLWVADSSLPIGAATTLGYNAELGDVNNIDRYTIGAGPLPWTNAPDLSINLGLGSIADLFDDVDIGPLTHHIFGLNYRLTYGMPCVQVYDPTGMDLLWSSLEGPLNVGPDFYNSAGVAAFCLKVSPDERFLAVAMINNPIWIVDLTNGVPDTSTLTIISNAPNSVTNEDVRGICWDAADNVYTVSSGQGLLRVFSPGIKSLAVTGNDSTGTNGSFLLVLNGEPTISWTNPAPITYGTPLSSTQLDATADVPGTFSYAPPAGTVLDYGTNELSVVFIPADTNDYQSVTNAVSLVVLQETQGFIYATTAGATIITGYYGDGGAVTIPATINALPVTGVGNYAFANLTNLTSVTLGANVASIGNSAFSGCRNLTSMSIPISVTSIGDEAFAGSGLYGVTLGANVASIGSNSFFACSNLTAITVAGPNPFYSSVNGVLFDEGQSTVIQYPCGRDGSYTISNGVTSIGDYAFAYCTGVTGVGIPSSVLSIGNDAFFGCTSLASVNIPGTVTSVGNATFSGCFGLTNATIANGVNNIGYEAFSGTSLTSVIIPGSVTSLGFYEFEDCTRLTNAMIASGVTSISDFVFYGCSSLTTVTIPGTVTSIGNYAFNGCSGLTSVTIPASVTGIGEFAFAFSGLTSVTIPADVSTIGDFAFEQCSSLSNVNFLGNAPGADSTVFQSDNNAIVYYLSGTTGWSSPFAGLPAVLWTPLIQTSIASFGVHNNQFGFNIAWASGMVVVVEASTNPAGRVWTPLQTNTLTNGSFYFSEPLQTNSSGRFYRVTSP